MSKFAISPRKLLQDCAVAGVVTSATGLTSPAVAASRSIKIGFVTPQAGPLAIFVVWLLLRSRWGLALTAVRDNEAVGVTTRRVKFMVHAFAAGVTGPAGAFIFPQKLRITPEAAFSVNEWTAFVIFPLGKTLGRAPLPKAVRC